MHFEHCTFEYFEDVERYWTSVLNIEPTLLQMSAGILNFEVRREEFDGVALTWVNSEGRQWWRDEAPKTGLHFGYVLESSGPVRAGGRELNLQEAMVWPPGQEVDYLLDGPLSSLEISVSQDRLDNLGWDTSGPAVRMVDRSALDKLTEICSMAAEWMRRTEHLPQKNKFVRGQLWQEWILDALASVISPWIAPLERGWTGIPITKHYDIVRQAETVFDSNNQSMIADADMVAGDLGISRRTLFYAFQKSLGIGPRRYYELKRLHNLRRDLRLAHRDDTSVTDLAFNNGFTQLGRLSGLYKRHFGESPSDTLRRSA